MSVRETRLYLAGDNREYSATFGPDQMVGGQTGSTGFVATVSLVLCFFFSLDQVETYTRLPTNRIMH